jgi:selenocysteine-specific elongation factor
VQLNLKEPVLALPGDRFVLRRPSPSKTIGGGVVIDPFPRKWLKRVNAVARLRRLRASDLTGRLELLVEEKINGRTLEELIRSTGYSAQAVKESLSKSSRLLLVDGDRRVMSKSWLTRRREQLLRWLGDFHLQHPSLPGAPIAQARLGLEPALANVVFAGFPAIKISGDLISFADYKPQMSRQESADLARLEQVFREAGYQPSNAMELVKAAGIRSKDDRALLQQLIKAGRLVRVSESLVFHADIVAHIRNSLSRHKGRRFSVPEFKEWTKISRKHAIPLLEYLDHQRVTKRDGDARVVL